MSLFSAIIKRIYQAELDFAKLSVKKNVNGLKVKISAIKKYLAEHKTLALLLKFFLASALTLIIYVSVILYNKFATLKTTAQAYFAQIGVELKRRENLIPNLVVSVEKYVSHEQEIFKHVSDARQIFATLGEFKEKLKVTTQLGDVLSKLLALVEQYPELKAVQSIQDLIKELTTTENRIVEQKAKYNDVVLKYNQLLSVFPTKIFAKFYGFSPLPFIGTDDDLITVPKVKNAS